MSTPLEALLLLVGSEFALDQHRGFVHLLAQRELTINKNCILKTVSTLGANRVTQQNAKHYLDEVLDLKTIHKLCPNTEVALNFMSRLKKCFKAKTCFKLRIRHPCTDLL